MITVRIVRRAQPDDDVTLEADRKMREAERDYQRHVSWCRERGLDPERVRPRDRRATP